MYTLEYLIQTFTRHSEETEKTHHRQRREFREEYPDLPLPSHMKEDFNISLALLCICQELQKIQEDV